MKADDFLALANELTAGRDEIHCRTAANRAYYAIYHCCCELLELLPPSESSFVSESKSDHRRVIDTLRNFESAALTSDDIRSLRRLGQWMDSTFRTRKNADYRLETSFNRRQLPMQMHRANQVLETATALRQKVAA